MGWGWLDQMKIKLTQPSFAKLGLGLSLAKTHYSSSAKP
jgi:hypothetical protein